MVDATHARHVRGRAMLGSIEQARSECGNLKSIAGLVTMLRNSVACAIGVLLLCCSYDELSFKLLRCQVVLEALQSNATPNCSIETTVASPRFMSASHASIIIITIIATTTIIIIVKNQRIA